MLGCLGELGEQALHAQGGGGKGGRHGAAPAPTHVLPGAQLPAEEMGGPVSGGGELSWGPWRSLSHSPAPRLSVPRQTARPPRPCPQLSDLRGCGADHSLPRCGRSARQPSPRPPGPPPAAAGLGPQTALCFGEDSDRVKLVLNRERTNPNLRSNTAEQVSPVIPEGPPGRGRQRAEGRGQALRGGQQDQASGRQLLGPRPRVAVHRVEAAVTLGPSWGSSTHREPPPDQELSERASPGSLCASAGDTDGRTGGRDPGDVVSCPAGRGWEAGW